MTGKKDRGEGSGRRDDGVKEGQTSVARGDGVSVFGLCYLITKINKSCGAGKGSGRRRGAKRTEANYTITRQ